MKRVFWGVVFLLLGAASALRVPGEIAAIAGPAAPAASTSGPTTGAALQSREELEGVLVGENPRVMVRVEAMRELSRRWPDRRTLELLKKVQDGIPQANREGWLARYLRADIARLEKTLEDRADGPGTSSAPAATRAE